MVLGATRTGKSTLAQRIFLSVPGTKLVIDPADSELTAVPGAVTYNDPKRPPDAEILRFVPRDPADRGAYDDVYRWVFEHPPLYVWLDEPDQAAPASGFPRYANTVVVQGAKRPIGHLTCATRPRFLMGSLLANAQHVIVFDLPNPKDRAYVADLAGVPLATLEGLMAELPVIVTPDGPKRGFVHWNQLTRTLTACPPLSLHR